MYWFILLQGRVSRQIINIFDVEVWKWIVQDLSCWFFKFLRRFFASLYIFCFFFLVPCSRKRACSVALLFTTVVGFVHAAHTRLLRLINKQKRATRPRPARLCYVKKHSSLGKIREPIRQHSPGQIESTGLYYVTYLKKPPIQWCNLHNLDLWTWGPSPRQQYYYHIIMCTIMYGGILYNICAL